jgi:hypothetical protein
MDYSVKPELFLPFDDRILIFNLFLNWSGHGINDARDRDSLAASMKEELLVLEISSLRAMTCLLGGPMSNNIKKVSFDLTATLKWLRSMYMTENVVEIADKALSSLLKYNHSNMALMDEIVDACYSSIGGNLFCGFTYSLVNMICDKEVGFNPQRLKCHPHKLLCLCIFQLGNAELSVRKSSVSLIHLFGKLVGSELIRNENEHNEISTISSDLPIIYKNSQYMISSRFAVEYAEMSPEVF